MAHLYNQKYYSSIVWVDCANGSLPSNPVVGGTGHHVYESGRPVYVGRVVYDGATIVGKICPDYGCCYFPVGGKEHHSDQYQVLSNPGNANLAWTWAERGQIPPGAIIGGQEKDGTLLFIGRAMKEGSMSVGKVNAQKRILKFALHWEQSASSFEVLVLV